MIWHKLENKTPIATESGCWDGLRSDKILVATRSRKIKIARMYEERVDGILFNNFYDDRDNEIDNVVYWTEIDEPF